MPEFGSLRVFVTLIALVLSALPATLLAVAIYSAVRMGRLRPTLRGSIRPSRLDEEWLMMRAFSIRKKVGHVPCDSASTVKMRRFGY